MSQALLERATKLRERYKTLESVKGSGYHDEDKNPSRPDLHLAPQKNGLPAHSGHLMAFYDHDDREEVHFVGECAERALAALQDWKAQAKPGTGSHMKLYLRIVPRLALAEVDGLPRLTIRLGDWNDVLVALHEMGLGVSGLPFNEG